MSDQAAKSAKTADVRARPETLDEFGCWLNTWGDLLNVHRARVGSDRQLAAGWVNGYEQAISDSLRAFEAVNPGWADGWRQWLKKLKV